ncbi:hypothetical protein CDO44_11785 [Pigmentiphaga sp. NML080357]|uniref:SPOR domain-containing protein n=1 Tax=Pigmentiphaga sp. NML080357 TaxID=2008675 RepID=UPI000B415B24|nr:SPOR domain-containing protein [Pigmentiphaga sp. NML080357]OVZ59290.1 hypothetical protein CDO44_11785 [Pigmentiphaga sp. NML080357]
MRSLFVVVLLANVALFALDRGWFGQPLSERGRDPGRLRTEIRADTIQVPRLPGINAAAGPAPARASEPLDGAAGSAGAPEAVSPVSAADPAPVNPTAATGASLDNPVALASAGPEQAAAAAPASPAAPDSPAPSPPAAAAPTAATRAAGSGSPAPLACVEWGAFSDADLAIAKKWSTEHLPAARQGTRREPGKQGWMVIVPPLGSAAAAHAAAAQLGRDGIKDFFVIQDGGPFQHAISLGVFSTENAARKQATALQAQGVRNAKVVSRAAQGGKSWLRLEGVSAADRRALDRARTLFTRPSVRDCR